MNPPADDLYAFLKLPPTAEPDAVRERITQTEQRLSGKHGLTLTELSRQRALLLQAKRWLLPADRRAEYDRQRANGPAVAAKDAAQKPVARPIPPAAPVAAATPAKATPGPSKQVTTTRAATAPPASATTIAPDDQDEEDASPSFWLSLPVLGGALAAATILAFAICFGVLWAVSGPDGDAPTATDAPVVEASPASVVEEIDEVPEATFIRADASDRIVLTPTNARLIGPTIRLDGAENPPRIENWTSSDSLEWEFESPSAAIYQATLEYGMKPESEGNRLKITAGSAASTRTVGAGAYADGTYRDVFFLKIEKRGPVTLKIEPLDVVGPELMQFRNLTLAPRQKTAAP